MGENAKSTEEIVTEAIKSKLEEARMIGIKIGYESAWNIAYTNVKKMTNAKDIKAYIKLKKEESSIIVNSQSKSPD